MHVGIFSKLHSNGGSEHRCVAMANAIVRHTSHQASLLCEQGLHPFFRALLDPRVILIENTLGDENQLTNLYRLDSLLVVVCDMYHYSSLRFWRGQSQLGTQTVVDLSQIPQICFLYNYSIAGVGDLDTLSKECSDVRIVCANTHFSRYIDEEEKGRLVRHLPRIVLPSPIEADLLSAEKTPSDFVRVGKHSKSIRSKYNPETPKLIEEVRSQARCPVAFDFMGISRAFEAELKDCVGTTVRREYALPVNEYLSGIDIFLFFVDWERFEPWARVIAEAMLSGCPVLANNSFGCTDQVEDGVNGFLCSSRKEFVDRLLFLIDNPEERVAMGARAKESARAWCSDRVIQSYIDFLLSVPNAS